jgi:indolepyruvate ferredoxin oxidoreductase
VVGIRVPDLVAYQDVAWARSYAEVVERVRSVEHQRVPGSSSLAEAVALGLYKLMSYKDEYEVARLQVDPEVQASVEAQFGKGATYAYRLHPPMLRALGRRTKMSFDGRAFRPVLRGLYAMRRVRGTALDPFGRTHMRRTERALIAEYRELVEQLLSGLTPENHSVAVQLAALPDMVRGYEHIKLGNVVRYREQRAEYLQQFHSAATPTSAAPSRS